MPAPTRFSGSESQPVVLAWKTILSANPTFYPIFSLSKNIGLEHKVALENLADTGGF